MQISELRTAVRARLLEFAWDEWAQMGVLATSQRHSSWAADPEALLLFTLEISRHDARLFEEVSDWMVRNEALMSTRRMRNLCRDETDRMLTDAFLLSVGRWRPRQRLTGDQPVSQAAPSRREPFFRNSRVPVRGQPDIGFLKHGWLKPEVEPSGKSQAPDLLAPINFSFRLRQILGVGARAEVVRVLLTIDSPRVSVQVVADSACYAKRNVQEALTSLHAAGVVDVAAIRNHQLYSLERGRWAQILALDQIPEHRDWAQLLPALRRLMRGLDDDRLTSVSDYMLASEARSLADEIAPDLRHAGIRIDQHEQPGAAYWQDFVELTGAALAALT